VRELIAKIIENDLSDLASKQRGEPILIGKADGQPVTLPRYGANILISGQPGSGKSTLATALLEQIIDRKYQLCLIDPEGNYEALPGCRVVGEEKQAPTMKQIEDALEEPATQVVVNLAAVPQADRPGYFASLIAKIKGLRIRTGRPHWLVLDEAHHMLPSHWAPSSPELVNQLSNLVLITVHPGLVSPAALEKIDIVIVVGRDPKAMLDEFADTVRVAAPETPPVDVEPGEAVVWLRGENRLIAKVKAEPSRSEQRRHKRKYAEGEL
jgi:AAA domain